jgi:hypothetical protein
VAAIEYPSSQLLGKPGDVEGQTAVLRATLEALETIAEPGEVLPLPFEWSEKRPDNHPQIPPPITAYLRKRP